MKLYLVLAFVVFSFTACAKSTLLRKNPSFHIEDLAGGNIVVMPAHSIVHEEGVFGKRSRMHAHEEHIERIIDDRIMVALHNMGYNAYLLSRYDIFTQKIDAQVFQIQNKYDAEIQLLYRDRFIKEEKAFSIKNNIGRVDLKLESNKLKNWLLFCDHGSISRSNASKVLGVLMNSDNNVGEVEWITIGIVDYDTGDIIWTNLGSYTTDIYSTMFKNTADAEKEYDIKKIDAVINNALLPLVIPK